MARLNGLTQEELAAIGDPVALAAAIGAELDAFQVAYRSDRHLHYTDEEVHAMVEARLAALPEHGPERTAIQKTYELLLAVIDGGVAETRTDHELTTWIDGDGSEWVPGFRAAPKFPG